MAESRLILAQAMADAANDPRRLPQVQEIANVAGKMTKQAALHVEVCALTKCLPGPDWADFIGKTGGPIVPKKIDPKP